jgi:hypothetical protein
MKTQDRKKTGTGELAIPRKTAPETATNLKTAKTVPEGFCGLNPEPQKSSAESLDRGRNPHGSFCGLNPELAEPWLDDLLTLVSPADWRSRFAHLAARYAEPAGSLPEARRWAWSDLQNRWRIANGERLRRDRCAGCGNPFGSAPFADLIDGNRVCLDPPEYACLAKTTCRWRRDAAKALKAMGIDPPEEC